MEEKDDTTVDEEMKMPGEPSKAANLNLKITEDERWAFKEFCVKHRMSQINGFRAAFELLQAHYQNKKQDE